MTIKIPALACLLLAGFSVIAADNIATLRGDAALHEQGKATALTPVENKDLRRKRNSPMEPPTIPHKIDNYQVDLRTNKCLTCHSRKRAADSQAPMVSVTHYMDRYGNFLAAVSPRRYFCQQCHVVQHDSKPLVQNTFKDIDELLQKQGDPR
ncbi:nitrate reductase cytochrome c-type subunit [Exilibacterium tricleocarpae]|uniref:Periplasmic nitrate reductase, electron transfer subunit n=1 Tax=Exilibacterium tricleocarpae TaxID=2591008 RepID=A0A545TAJ0_9GAMM|nr:nitrate reductase cytochrome c-type subunit [Exilibacterium tricleocarpae]TQV74225.1 nitrate reductase cytochrome c-type subunit [Exilibacterium tricleocarpae]